ncbi:hypothetical protein KJ966_08115 [bacterium]|nr:hypothetical protein [bacterium]
MGDNRRYAAEKDSDEPMTVIKKFNALVKMIHKNSEISKKPVVKKTPDF